MKKRQMKDLCEMNNFTSLFNKSACFKNPSEPTTIDLILIIKRVEIKIDM